MYCFFAFKLVMCILVLLQYVLLLISHENLQVPPISFIITMAIILYSYSIFLTGLVPKTAYLSLIPVYLALSNEILGNLRNATDR